MSNERMEQPDPQLIVVADYWLGSCNLEIFKRELFIFWTGNRYAGFEERPYSDSEHFQLWPCAHRDLMDWYAIRREGETMGMIEVAQRLTDHVQVLVGTVNGQAFSFVLRLDAWLNRSKRKVSPAIGVKAIELLPEPPIPTGGRRRTWTSEQWDEIFDWYHRIGRSVCPNLMKLAERINRPYKTVRNKHAEYLSRRPGVVPRFNHE